MRLINAMLTTGVIVFTVWGVAILQPTPAHAIVHESAENTLVVMSGAQHQVHRHTRKKIHHLGQC